MAEDDNKVLTISLLGNSGVGKTTLIQRYINNSISDISLTIGYNILSQNLSINNKNYTIDYIDSSGNPYYESSFIHLVKQSHAIIIVTDNTQTLSDIDSWRTKALAVLRNPAVPFFLAINKFDLKFPENLIEDLEKYSDFHDVSIHKLSALENTNISFLFDLVEKKVIRLSSSSSSTSLKLSNVRHSVQLSTKKSDKCC